MKISVYIVKENTNSYNKILDSANNFSEIDIIGHTDNISTALDNIKTYNPYVVILDFESPESYINGLELVHILNDFSDNKKPFIIVTSNTSDSVIYNFLNNNNVNIIFSKLKNDYSEIKVLNFINLIKGSIITKNSNLLEDDCLETDNSCDYEALKKILISDIQNELNKINMKSNISGYTYITNAILISVINHSVIKLNTLAKLLDQPAKNIDHAIRTAINYTWTHTSQSILDANYSGSISNKTGVPSITMFVSFYTNIFSDKYQKVLEII